MVDTPLVSIIVTIWNSKPYISQCLDRLVSQTLNDFEVILLDNGSTDGASDNLESYKSKLNLRLESLERNLGFSKANNLGSYLAQGKWIILLNADAFPEPDWLENLIYIADKNPQYNFFTSRQIQYTRADLLDGAGDEYHVSGLAWRRYYNYPEKKYGLEQNEIFGACAAAAMYCREDFLEIGGFDEDFFSYFEDVDLSFRLRLQGGKCLYVPQAIVHHVGSASTGKISDFVVYYGHRNLVWTYFKDMPFLLLCLFLPLHFIMNLYFLISFTIKGKGSTIFKAKIDAFLGLPDVIKKRKKIQKTRTVSTLEIYRLMSRGLFEPYFASRRRKQEFRNKKI